MNRQKEREAAKEAKRAKAAAEKEEKNRQQMAKVVEEWNEKQANAASASSPVDKLKALCSKPPYLDITGEVKVRPTDPCSTNPPFLETKS